MVQKGTQKYINKQNKEVHFHLPGCLCVSCLLYQGINNPAQKQGCGIHMPLEQREAEKRMIKKILISFAAPFVVTMWNVFWKLFTQGDCLIGFC